MPNIPDPPRFLNDVAKRRWCELWQILDPEIVTPERHGDSVAIYCQAYAGMCEAVEKIGTTGAVAKSGDRIITNPYVAVRDACVKTMLELAPELGISPGTGKIVWPVKEVM